MINLKSQVRKLIKSTRLRVEDNGAEVMRSEGGQESNKGQSRGGIRLEQREGDTTSDSNNHVPIGNLMKFWVKSGREQMIIRGK